MWPHLLDLAGLIALLFWIRNAWNTAMTEIRKFRHSLISLPGERKPNRRQNDYSGEIISPDITRNVLKCSLKSRRVREIVTLRSASSCLATRRTSESTINNSAISLALQKIDRPAWRMEYSSQKRLQICFQFSCGAYSLKRDMYSSYCWCHNFGSSRRSLVIPDSFCLANWRINNFGCWLK